MLILALDSGQKMAEGTNWYLIVPLTVLILVVGITLAVKNLRNNGK